MSRSDCIRRAKETINARRDQNIALWERHIAEVSQKLPEFRAIDQELNLTGTKIFAASLGKGGQEALDEIRREYEALAARRKEILKENGYPDGYCDIQYTCKKCSDSGYVGIDLCDCLKKEIVKSYLESSGLYSLTQNQTFETFSLDYYDKNDKAIMKQNAEILWRYAHSFVSGEADSFLFIGATGLGKTHLSSAVAKVVIEGANYVVYEPAQSLFSDYEMRRFGNSSYGTSDEEDEIERYTDCDLLIIDDLGAEITNQFTVSCLYNLLNTRIIRHKATIISTNLNQDELRKRYSERITSRLFGEFHPLLFTGDDVRMQKIKRGSK